jgi:pantoate--beta-alanine ligase
MGFLHEGHLSLVRRAREVGDTVVVSIFVNPLQFGPGEDLEAYPRHEERDAALLEELGTDVLFVPTEEEFYPLGHATRVSVTGPLAERLCGAQRPGHFDGVATVVARLFGLVRPRVAVFGAKDYQQYLVVKRVVEDLDLGVEVEARPIVREPDGLAMSSRNTYLGEEERRQALGLSRALTAARERVAGGESDPLAVARAVRDVLETHPLVRPQYVEVVSAEDLGAVECLEGRVLVALAAHVGSTRLIDNCVLDCGAGARGSELRS